MAFYFKVFISIRQKDDDRPIYQKQDGQRFSQTHTTKLNVNTSYAVKIRLRPPIKLTDAIIQGESMDIEELKKEKDDDDDTISYASQFSTTGYELSKRQKRKDVVLTLMFERGYSLMVTLQCKFYEENETEHCHWGQALTWLEYECKVDEGSSHVDVLKERYL